MRVYAYGARPPIEGAELVREQLWLATIYQKVLVLLERERRETVEQLYRDACPAEWAAYEAAEQAAEAAAQAVRLSRSTGGELLRPDEEMKTERDAVHKAAVAALTEARQREAEARQAWGDARKRATKSLRPQLKWIDTDVKARQKHAYNAAGSVGLAWGTRLKVGESVERAAQAAAKAGSLPRIPRFDGAGATTVQLQGKSGIDGKNGLAPADALTGGDTRVRLEYVDRPTWQRLQGRSAFVGSAHREGGEIVKNGPRAGQPRQPLPQPDPNSKTSQRNKHCAIARLRVGSNGQKPVWAAWPVVVHRDSPADAPITWAQMHARRVGPRTEWKLNLTVDDVLPSMRDTSPTLPTLAVNFGWRPLLDGGLRVAYAVGSDGNEEEVRVPHAYTTGAAHVDEMRGTRDRLFEKAKKALVEWIQEGERPAWLIEEARWVDRWRTQRKLVRLISHWGRQRFDGDAGMWSTIVAWQKKDRHLWFWEADEREQLLKMRRDFYRNVAARWATSYARILVTDMDLRDFAKLPAPEEAAKSEGKVQRVLQKLAAPSVLRDAIKNACSTRGAFFEEADGLFKTQTCNACGLVFTWAARQAIGHTCQCGVRWDQDANHCRNLLSAARPPQIVTEPGKKKGRWQKRKDKAAVADGAKKTG
jgi:hypothetical protein